MRSKRPFSAGNPTFVIFILFLLASAIVPTHAQARKFKVLHTFHGVNGAFPITQLARDAQGNLYGTTSAGGTGVCKDQKGCRTVFKLNKKGKQLWLHSFEFSGGESPMAGLLRDKAGNLYGTTVFGGSNITACQLGCGVLFKLDSKGKETVLHRFKGGTSDGMWPEALPIRDSAGNLYGTTIQGGQYDEGTAFKLDKAGIETILSMFDFTDGGEPFPGVISDAAGNLYGTTSVGGTNRYGVIFELDTAGTEILLHDFAGGLDGAYPSSVLIRDAAGNLYGTTTQGGSVECGGTGCGTIFELSPGSSGSWTVSVLYVFCSVSNCADGERPISGPLVRDSAGNLYGTTYFGGTNDAGIVFKLDGAGKETVLHSFTGGTDGAYPWAGLTMDDAGTLYGTTQAGGDLACYRHIGCGIVFSITP